MATLFRNGLVVDGLGGYLERSDVLVDGERIAAVGRDLAMRRAATPASLVESREYSLPLEHGAVEPACQYVIQSQGVELPH